MFKVVKTLESVDYVVYFYRNFKVEKIAISSTCTKEIHSPLDEFYVDVRKFRTNRFGREVADCASESFISRKFDKVSANGLYFNIKTGYISYNSLKDALKEFDIWEIYE